MNILEAIVLGIIQGLTEFIPVSSSGHLLLLHHSFGTQGANDLAFDVALHIGTLVALLLYFGRDLVDYARSLLVKSDKTRLTWLLIVATIPAALAGYLLETMAESTFRSPRLVAFNLLIVGVVMLLAEYFYSKQKKHTSLENVTRTQALSMGFAQALAIVPGVSRSGSTIMAGLFTGLDRVAATRFSFLLGVPIISGAIVRVLSGGNTMQEVADNKSLFIIGIITAFLSGVVAIRFMLKFLSKHGLHIFAYYRIVLGVLVLLALGIW